MMTLKLFKNRYFTNKNLQRTSILVYFMFWLLRFKIKPFVRCKWIFINSSTAGIIQVVCTNKESSKSNYLHRSQPTWPKFNYKLNGQVSRTIRNLDHAVGIGSSFTVLWWIIMKWINFNTYHKISQETTYRKLYILTFNSNS